MFTLYFVFLSTFLLALEETAFLFFVPCTFGALFYFCVDHDPSFGNIMTDGATISEHVRYMHVVYQKKKKKKKRYMHVWILMSVDKCCHKTYRNFWHNSPPASFVEIKKVISPFSNVCITFAHFQMEENRTQILSRECDQEIIPLYCLSIM